MKEIKFPPRRNTRSVWVGRVEIGASAPISIQSMLSVPLTSLDSAIAQARALGEAGCDIIRVAVPDKRSVPFLREFRQAVDLPLVADIHFDYRLAIASAEAGVDKLRVNPGNIGSRDKVAAVAEAAASFNIPIRIGVNAGSLPPDLIERPDRAQAMLVAALREIEAVESTGFSNLVVSLKSHDVPTTILANRMFSRVSDIPLHLGVTEAGSVESGSIKNALGIGALILDGIGDTVRVSLTGDPIEEVTAARGILRACGRYSKGIEIISCPTCGRTKVDVASVVREIERRLRFCDKPLKVAVMGCEVNGPGEAREADIGFAGTADGFVVFERGKIRPPKIPSKDAIESIVAIVEEAASIIDNRKIEP